MPDMSLLTLLVVLQVCEESGTDLAQTILKSKKKASKQSAQRATSSVKSDVSGTLLSAFVLHVATADMAFQGLQPVPATD